MYEPLPLRPGPVVRSPAAPVLRTLLRVFNVVLAAVALLLIVAALWMEVQYKHGGGGGEAPPPTPAPRPEPAPEPSPEPAPAPSPEPIPSPPPTPGDEPPAPPPAWDDPPGPSAPADQPPEPPGPGGDQPPQPPTPSTDAPLEPAPERPLVAALAVRLLREHAASSSKGSSSGSRPVSSSSSGSSGGLGVGYAAHLGGGGSGGGGAPWFIAVVGAAGAYALATALAGLAGAQQGHRWQPSGYIALLAGLMLAEAGALLLLFTDNAWRERLPEDPSGRWDQAQQFVDANPHAVEIAFLAVMGAELAALLAAMWLHAIYQAAYEAWLDDRQEASERTRALLHHTVQENYSGGSGSLWARRMKEKYGVDASQVAASASGARQTAALSGDALLGP